MDLPLYICSGKSSTLTDTPDYNVCVRDVALLLIGNKKQRSQFAPSPEYDIPCNHEPSGNGKMVGRLLGPTRRCQSLRNHLLSGKLDSKMVNNAICLMENHGVASKPYKMLLRHGYD